MSASRSGSLPRKSTRRSSAGARAGAVFVCALALAGCNATTRHNASWPGEPQRLAAAVPSPVKVEIEDDGVPAQHPPTTRIRQMPDDPREPFSRNYGSQPARAAEAKPASRPVIPDDLPPAFRAKLAAALDE